jgi:hypothetical protein
MIRIAVALFVLTAVAHADDAQPPTCDVPTSITGDMTAKMTLVVGCAGGCGPAADTPQPSQQDRQWIELSGRKILVHRRWNDRLATIELSLDMVTCRSDRDFSIDANRAKVHGFDGTVQSLGKTSVIIKGESGSFDVHLYASGANSSTLDAVLDCLMGCHSDGHWSGHARYPNGKPLDPAAAARADAEQKRRDAIEAAERARAEAAAERERAAHVQQLKNSFPPRPTKRPVTPEIRKQKADCLHGDGTACAAVQPPSPDPVAACHKKMDAEWRACTRVATPCFSKCTGEIFDCALTEHLAACAKDFRSAACAKTWGCSTKSTCDCPHCSAILKKCGDGPPSRTTAQ